MLAFYCDVRGLQLRYQSVNWVEMEAGDVNVAPWRFGPGPAGPPELAVSQGAAIFFEVECFVTARWELEGRGV